MRTPQRTRTVWGRIDGPSGGVRAGSPDFTVVRAGAGLYDITFSPPFSGPPAVTHAVSQASSNDYTVQNAPSTGAYPQDGSRSIRIQTINNVGTPADSDFSFTATGPA